MLHQHPVVAPNIAGAGAAVTTPISVAGFEPARRFFTDRFAELDPSIEALLVVHLDAQARLLHLARYDGDAASLTLPLRAILLDAV